MVTREEIRGLKNGNRQYGVIDKLLHDIYFYDISSHEEKSEEEIKGHHYRYIPFSRVAFVDNLIKIIKMENKQFENFIDVGCGIGDKVILAEIFGNFNAVTGLELNTTTYHVAKYFLENRKMNFQSMEDFYKTKTWINPFTKEKKDVVDTDNLRTKREFIHENAFNHNFSKYDFIYLYVPIADWELMLKLHEKLLREMPVGGILWEVSAVNSVEKALKIIKKEDKFVRIPKRVDSWSCYPFYFKRISNKTYKVAEER